MWIKSDPQKEGAVETRLLHPPRSFNEAEHHASLLLCLKKIHKYGCCLARSAAALSYCLSLMEISSINFVSKSLVFPERRRRSLPTHRTFWCLQGFKTGNVRSNRGQILEDAAIMLIMDTRISLRTFRNTLSDKRLTS